MGLVFKRQIHLAAIWPVGPVPRERRLLRLVPVAAELGTSNTRFHADSSPPPS